MGKKVLFMGTPSYATEIFKKLLSSNYEVIGLFTQPDKPVGRKQVLTPPDIKQFCIDNNEEPLQCDGCGYIGEDVYTDSGGFNICSSGKCNSYSVRGLSQSDFY